MSFQMIVSLMKKKSNDADKHDPQLICGKKMYTPSDELPKNEKHGVQVK
jgi:hypothetical protein